MQLLDRAIFVYMYTWEYACAVCVGVYMRAWWVGGGWCGWVCMCGCVTAM